MKHLKDEDAILYDRQIRLWGAASQHRMMESHVLVSGLNGTGAELVKNLVLGGVGSVTLHDTSSVTYSDVCANFFLSESQVGKNRAESSLSNVQELNPKVRVDFDKESLLERDAAWISRFTVVVLCTENSKQRIHLSHLCRDKGIAFFVMATHGMFGYIFCDAAGQKYVVDEEDEKKKKEVLTFPGSLSYTDMLSEKMNWDEMAHRRARVSEAAFAFLVLWHFEQLQGKLPSSEDTVLMRQYRDQMCAARKAQTPTDIISNNVLDALTLQAKGEFSPVCAILGGICSQFVVRVLTGKGKPMDNFFIFDEQNHVGKVERMILQ